VQPVLSVNERRALDAASPVGLEELIQRAGYGVARYALHMMGGGYGRRVVVVAGPGNNGADGKVAAEILRRRGALVEVVAPGDAISHCDLVIDAAFGSGLSRAYHPAPLPQGAKVLAVDVPSGVNGDTGELLGEPWKADTTVTFVAPAPGVLQGDGARLAGKIEVIDIGLTPVRPMTHIIEDCDLDSHLHARGSDAHKWQRALCLLAGGKGMEGAGILSASASIRAGASMVRLFSPKGAKANWPIEVVRTELKKKSWPEQIAPTLTRCHAVAVGPGIGRSATVVKNVRATIKECTLPMVIDADGLYALSPLSQHAGVLKDAKSIILTPHEGEFRALVGEPVRKNRIEHVREVAQKYGVVLLLKGSLTVVANPDGKVLLSLNGPSALATAGTGDVLTGIIGALCAGGVTTFFAAALSAHIHARAGALRGDNILRAGDLPDLVGQWLSTRVEGHNG
jgi:NAD(P)H-hydrate epimerase